MSTALAKQLATFLHPCGVGIDICQISRIFQIVGKSPQHTDRFISRVFAKDDPTIHVVRQKIHETLRSKPEWQLDAANSNGHEMLSQQHPELWAGARFLASRFAAKEAAIKAHSHRKLTFHDISILKAQEGEERLGGRAPYARIKAASGDEKDSTALISISHDGDYAVAVCVAEKAASRE
ncbi:uncharacterized protein F5Z01DRAFT_156113 [Emericellopsis atlantica]|uniref:4'-phosphopantetheinyl transferase domain-containing protein n=1 Tax=Emericellopsis atlantica TaxID=2614577 RepID=A0A9P7ZK44_9HYPO|nr:uncharacterized protein F5Z01DRAFT_156113 [Emericellopsis atlantica]KAG9253191.1 hypothetical protein F5Z01DRAFT_156113 [Emericellopsis atlantica]